MLRADARVIVSSRGRVIGGVTRLQFARWSAQSYYESENRELTILSPVFEGDPAKPDNAYRRARRWVHAMHNKITQERVRNALLLMPDHPWRCDVHMRKTNRSTACGYRTHDTSGELALATSAYVVFVTCLPCKWKLRNAARYAT